MEINYVKGDATNPASIGNKIIAHVCNDIGGWGKGFVMAISKRWKVQFVKTEDYLWVANLIG